MRALLITVFAFFITSSASLADVKAGDPLPSKLELLDKNAEAQSFETIKGEKGAVLVFVRSADWCPYCQVQLLDLRAEDGAKITDLGYNIIAISYDAPEKLKTFAERYNFDHVMLSDKGSEVIKAFGILNEDFAPDHFAYGVPHPHIYIVSNDGIIQAVLSEEGYKKRPQADVIVKAIKSNQ